MEGIANKRQHNDYYTIHNLTGLTWPTVYSELFDNSLDNFANNIYPIFTDTFFTIIDDGTGIQPMQEDVENVISMNRSSSKEKSGMIGQYGVGFNHSNMRLGNFTHVISKAPECDIVEFDIPWESDENIKFQTSKNGFSKKQGTSITTYFDKRDKKNPPPPNVYTFRNYDKLVRAEKLKIIDSKGQIYEPDELPIFEKNIKGTPINPYIKKGIIYKGKKFDITIGVLSKESPNRLSGFYVYSIDTLRYFSYAISTLDNNLEAKDGLYIEIGLYNTKEEWRIDTNKREIIDIELVLDYLKLPQTSFPSSLFDYYQQALRNETEIEDLTFLKDAFSPYHGGKKKGKEKRPHKGNNKGTISPVDSGNKRLKAQVVDFDNYGQVAQKNDKIKTGLDFKAQHLGDRIGRDRYWKSEKNGQENIIIFNKDNKTINRLTKSKSIPCREVLSIMAGIFLQADRVPKDQFNFNLTDKLSIQHQYFTDNEE